MMFTINLDMFNNKTSDLKLKYQWKLTEDKINVQNKFILTSIVNFDVLQRTIFA